MSTPSSPRAGRLWPAALLLLLLAGLSLSVGTGRAQAGSLVAGDSHMCAITTETKVLCWGSNMFGQLGTGDEVSSNRPVEVVGLSGATSLTTNSSATCAIAGGGSVWCWGASVPYAADFNWTTRPRQVPELTGAVQISLTNGSGLCVLRADRTVACAEPAPGQTPAQAPFVPVEGATGVKQLSGECVLVAKQRVKCWKGFTEGPNQAKERRSMRGAVELATACTRYADGTANCTGYADSSASAFRSKHRVRGVTDARGLSSGNVACLIRKGGTVSCDGQPGTTKLTRERRGPGTVTGLRGVVALASNLSATCAVTADGAVRCWGIDAPATGLGAPASSATPIPVAGLSSVAQLESGSRHTCARRSTGDVTCWGTFAGGAVGAEPQVTPTGVRGIRNTGLFGANDFGTCALSTDRTLRCWSLRLGTDGAYGDPIVVGKAPAGTTIVDGSCLLAGGRVHCLAAARRAKKGKTRLTLQPMAGVEGATALDVNLDHGCAVVAGGQVSCWGYGVYYDVERGSTKQAPALVPGVSGAVSVTVNHVGGCALLAGGTLSCWGNAGAAVATPHPKFADVRALAWTPRGVCATTGSGSVLCERHADDRAVSAARTTWTAGEELSPVAGATDATGITAGDSHTCILRAGGTVACWGDGFGGALGDGPAPGGHGPVTAPGIVDGLTVKLPG